MGEFHRVLKFICSECGEREKVAWNYVDVYNTVVAVECWACENTAQVCVSPPPEQSRSQVLLERADLGHTGHRAHGEVHFDQFGHLVND